MCLSPVTSEVRAMRAVFGFRPVTADMILQLFKNKGKRKGDFTLFCQSPARGTIVALLKGFQDGPLVSSHLQSTSSNKKPFIQFGRFTKSPVPPVVHSTQPQIHAFLKKHTRGRCCQMLTQSFTFSVLHICALLIRFSWTILFQFIFFALGKTKRYISDVLPVQARLWSRGSHFERGVPEFSRS